jgi:ATPase subunit of ABC transporter with duplicated ATPase domains
LNEFAGTAVVISHDRWFLDRVCTNTLAFEDLGNGKSSVEFFDGPFSEYRESKSRRDSKVNASSSGMSSSSSSGMSFNNSASAAAPEKEAIQQSNNTFERKPPREAPPSKNDKKGKNKGGKKK